MRRVGSILFGFGVVALTAACGVVGLDLSENGTADPHANDVRDATSNTVPTPSTGGSNPGSGSSGSSGIGVGGTGTGGTGTGTGGTDADAGGGSNGPTCAAPSVYCANALKCVDLASDAAHCGACANDCKTALGGVAGRCDNGQCVKSGSGGPGPGNGDGDGSERCSPGAVTCIDAVAQVCTDQGEFKKNGPAGEYCVEACSIADRFRVVQGGLVLDATTGLRWDRLPQTNQAHASAATTCAVHAARLPTRAELLALVNKPNDCSPPIDQAAFPATSAVDFWTSEATLSGVHVVNFATGAEETAPGTYTLPFRCVR